MADPLTALMHAVQVMNFLKTLIERTLKEREDSVLDSALDSYSRDPSGDNGCHTPLQTIHEDNNESEPDVADERKSTPVNSATSMDNEEEPTEDDKIHRSTSDDDNNKTKPSNKPKNTKNGQNSTTKKGTKKISNEKLVNHVSNKSAEKTKGTILVSSVKLRNDRIEAWR